MVTQLHTPMCTVAVGVLTHTYLCHVLQRNRALACRLTILQLFGQATTQKLKCIWKKKEKKDCNGISNQLMHTDMVIWWLCILYQLTDTPSQEEPYFVRQPECGCTGSIGQTPSLSIHSFGSVLSCNIRRDTSLNIHIHIP